MNRDRIRDRLNNAGYDVELAADKSTLTVRLDIRAYRLELVHIFPDTLLHLPVFRLAGGYDGKLAHVGVGRDGRSRTVCVADSESTAINLDRPTQVYLETVQQHEQMLRRLIEDPEYNRTEQLREFDAHWRILCQSERDKYNEVFLTWNGERTERLQVTKPRKHSSSILNRTHVAWASSHRSPAFEEAGGREKRPIVGKAIGVPLLEVEPVPADRAALLPWYFRVTSLMNPETERDFRRLRKRRHHDYWLAFSAPVPQGTTVFAIRWQSAVRARLPSTQREAEEGCWKVTPYRARSISRNSLVPRGGGVVDFHKNSVLLIGTGSVGAHLAMMLASVGIGRLTISDPDTFSEENLYRHPLSVWDVGRGKTVALKHELIRRYPWADISADSRRLEDFQDGQFLQSFDLVAIAIGSPNEERTFADFCRRHDNAVPVLNCWLEACGIGGHAILSIPRRKGCWHCAYVDLVTRRRGLTSSLNFLEPGQMVVRSQGGCGAGFLPYNGIAANCTATMAADLAVQFLSSQLGQSSKVSWKGNELEATRASLRLTQRCQTFSDSLRILPLYDENCDLCAAK